MLFEDHFDGPVLDPLVWVPHYLPAWSSRAATLACHEVRDSCLRLSIPPTQGRWLPGEHEPPLRVSGIQSGNFSGPAGSTIGQQPWRDGAVVREAQEEFWGWTPLGGRLEIRARAELTPRSMVAWWLIGREQRPQECAEICVMEIFDDAVVPGRSAAVGMGLHAFRDPRTPEDFETVAVPLDVSEFHTYSVDWTESSADFFVDGERLRSCPEPPAYPMQMMLAVFDFPAGTATGTPAFIVDYIRGTDIVRGTDG